MTPSQYEKKIKRLLSLIETKEAEIKKQKDLIDRLIQHLHTLINMPCA
tara:strand:- start:1369 stop:1512 length:144 start_codon:yes stop_codon:yes gene_type:complete